MPRSTWPTIFSLSNGSHALEIAADEYFDPTAIDAYSGFLLTCRENGDSTPMKLFEVVIDEEQAHFNYFDNVNDHIAGLGPAYLAQEAGTSSATGLNTQGFVARAGGA